MSDKRFAARAASLIAAAIAFAAAMASGLSAAADDGVSDKARAAYEAGMNALRERRFEEAVDLFDEVLDEQRDHPEANYFTGLAYAYSDEDRRARRHLQRAVEARSTFLEARDWLAVVHVRRGDPDAAEEQLAALRALRDGCTPNLCDEAYMARADRAIARVEAALAGEP